MGFIKDFRNFRKIQKRDASTIDSHALTQWLSELSLGGFLGSTNNALKHSVAFACIRLLSEVPASLPRMVYKDRPTAGKDPAKNHPVYSLLHKPNRYMNGIDFEQLMFARCQTHGNAIALKVKNINTGYTKELLPIPYEDVEVKLHDGDVWYGIKNKQFNIYGVYPSSDVIHRKIFSNDGIVGRSPMKYAYDNIKNGLSAEEFERTFWDKGGLQRFWVEHPQAFPDIKKWEEWAKSFKKANEGSTSKHGTMHLDGGRKMHEIKLPVPDAAFINLKTFNVQDICRFFGVPPHMVFDLMKASYNTLEQQNASWVQNRLRYDVKLAEEEYQTKLFTPSEQKTHHVKYILDGLLRGNTQAITALTQMLITTGTFTRNEIRDIYFNANPLDAEGMNEPLNPAFLTGLQQQNENQNSNTDGNE